MRKWTYFKLLDTKHKNQIVRADGRFQQHYTDGKWVRSGVLLDYQIEISPYHDLYERISESEVIAILGEEAIKELV